MFEIRKSTFSVSFIISLPDHEMVIYRTIWQANRPPLGSRGKKEGRAYNSQVARIIQSSQLNNFCARSRDPSNYSETTLFLPRDFVSSTWHKLDGAPTLHKWTPIFLRISSPFFFWRNDAWIWQEVNSIWNRHVTKCILMLTVGIEIIIFLWRRSFL